MFWLKLGNKSIRLLWSLAYNFYQCLGVPPFCGRLWYELVVLVVRTKKGNIPQNVLQRTTKYHMHARASESIKPKRAGHAR